MNDDHKITLDQVATVHYGKIYLAKVLTVADDVGAVRLTQLDLHHRRKERHDDGDWNIELGAVVGEGEGMVAGAGGDHTAFLLLLGGRKKKSNSRLIV